MDWSLSTIALVFGGCFLAGAINTLAGNGSAITLGILMELLGLPGTIANATNRVGVFGQTLSGALVFQKHGHIEKSTALYPTIITSLGAIAGIILSIYVSNEQFRTVYQVMMIVMLSVVLVKPKRWLQESNAATREKVWWMQPIYFAIGVYGGFIQMGMGIFFLAAMVLGARFNIISGNALKSVVIAIYTAIAIAIFQWKGLIRWDIGLIMAVGQIAGGVITAQFASTSKWAGKVAYYLLVVIVVSIIVRWFL